MNKGLIYISDCDYGEDFYDNDTWGGDALGYSSYDTYVDQVLTYNENLPQINLVHRAHKSIRFVEEFPGSYDNNRQTYIGRTFGEAPKLH